MIIPDVNLLIYAYNDDAPHHVIAKAWWEEALNGDVPVALPWVVILGFVRLMSNRRVLARPMHPDEALAQSRAWLEQPVTQLLLPGPSHVDLLAHLLASGRPDSNLVTDAHLAALAIENQAELFSNDADFGRFPGLRWRNPLS